MLGVRLDGEMQARLDRLADATRRTKSSLAKEALDLFLTEEEARLLRRSARERLEHNDRLPVRTSLRTGTDPSAGTEPPDWHRFERVWLP